MKTSDDDPKVLGSDGAIHQIEQSLTKAAEFLGDAETATLERFWRMAKDKVNSSVSHVVQCGEKDLLKAIEDSTAGAMRGENGRYVAIIRDCKVAGQPSTAPHLRVCNFLLVVRIYRR